MKKYLFLITMLLVGVAMFVGCNKNIENLSVDYSQYSFVNTSWTRDTTNDTETIRFGSDGSFSYSCGCGNPVNDSDLCEGYTYNHTTKTITLNYLEATDETITTIKIIKCDENSLHLDFDGEIIIFKK